MRVLLLVGSPKPGALAFGGGGALEGRPIERSPLARAAPLLRQTVGALDVGLPVPEQARQAFARQFVPSWAYTLFGGFGWWWLARKRGGREPLRMRRYRQ